MKYTCPMHPDIIRETPGKCPKCGMELVLEGSPKVHGPGIEKTTWRSYSPLLIIIGVILLVSVLTAIRGQVASPSLSQVALNFMAGFFLVFSTFKLIDLKGFAAGYSTYDLLAQKVFAYGYIYPFLELFFGLAMVAGYHGRVLLGAEVILMLWSGIGVGLKLAKREEFQCVCLGTFLKVPLTKVTLIEDFGMSALALVLLLIR